MRVAYAAITARFSATAMSRSTLSENATSMIRSTPSGGERADVVGRVRAIERDDVIDRLRARLSQVGVAPDRAYDGGGAAPAGELGGESAHASEHAVAGGPGPRSIR